MEINLDLEFTLTPHQRSIYDKPEYKNVSKFRSADEERNWARTQLKMCKDCKQTLPLSYFNGNTSGRDPFDKNGYRLRRPECKSCTKANNSGKDKARKEAKRSGMTHKAPEGTKCELCHTTEMIVFDHDHLTNLFRGWLCDSCNRSIGVLGDNLEGIVKVVNYLKKHQKSELVIDKETGELKIL